MLERQCPKVLPQRVGLDVGHEDGVPEMGGRAAGAHGWADRYAVDRRVVRRGKRWGGAVAQMLAIFVALIVTMPFMVCLGLGGIRLWVKVTAVPRSVIAGLVGAMCLLGSYASVNDMFAMWTTIVFGILGYFLHKVKIHPAPIVLALILGGMTESNFRRSLMASGGQFATFVTHPVGVVCAILALLVFLMPFMRRKPQAPALAH